MTKNERQRFYRRDRHEYNLSANDGLREKIDEFKKMGYMPYVSLIDLQSLIYTVAKWYEFKYPEKEFEFYETFAKDKFQEDRELSDLMNLKQLFYRLTNKQVAFLMGCYRDEVNTSILIANGEIPSSSLNLKVNRFPSDNYYSKYHDFSVRADVFSGDVSLDYELEKYISAEDLKLDDVFQIFEEKYFDRLDYSSLRFTINNHNFDVALRDEVLRLIALKLLYSTNTTPDRGYERAKRFIGEFNKKLGLDISTSEIDKLAQADYSKEDVRWAKSLRSYYF